MEEETTKVPEVKEEQKEQEADASEPSVSDLHDEKKETPKKVENVPIARLNKEIERRKQLEKELADARREANNDDDIDDVDDAPDVKKLADKLEQIEERERRTSLEVKFKQGLDKALENSPEYKDLVNVNVIQSLAFDPANANKTYKQLLEEVYGNALTGRRTIETTTPRGGAKDTVLDRKRAEKDVEYRREVLADPELRKQYNEGLTDRVFR